MASDCDFLLDVLKDHGWHSTAELLRYSIEERGCGLTVHSRVSDLRGRGLNVEYRRVKGERAQAHQYRLVGVRTEEGAVGFSGPDDHSPLLGPPPPSDVGPPRAQAPAPPPGAAGLPSRPPRPPKQLSVFEAAA